MNKKIAVITDIHGNFEGLNAILSDIKKQNIGEIICLGDTVSLGPNSKECIDKLIDENIKMVLGNHELYILRGTDIDPSIEGEEINYYNWVKESLAEKEMDYIKQCPLYYEYNITPNKKLIFCHYLIKDENKLQPFETSFLKKDINLYIKYNTPDILYIIGHLHNYYDVNEVDGISENYIEKTQSIPNIEIVESAGCTKTNTVSYMIIEIDKSINIKRIKVPFDREKFIQKIMNIDFPDKKNILKYFYGIE